MIEMWDGIFNDCDPSVSGSIENGKGVQAFEAMHGLLDRSWAECYRVIADGGYVCINIGDATRSLGGHFSLYSNHARIIRSMEALGFHSLPYIIWQKPTNSPTKFMGSGMLPSGAYVTLEHEFVLIFRKGRIRKFDPDGKKARSQSALFWEERNRWYSDSWQLPGVRQSLLLDAARKRSAAFPVELALRLIAMHSVYGDCILDPFSGTASTTTAALILARNSIAMDCDPELVDASQKQYTKHGVKNILNQRIQERLRDHLNYVASKDSLFFRYKNQAHKVPVKTRQEKALQFRTIKSIKRTENSIEATYKKLSRSFVDGLLEEWKSKSGQSVSSG